MAATDARPVPRKNIAFRVTFPILDADGDLVSAAASLDSEVSKDGAAFADCTSEATEIATGSGMYYLDLTSTEMNADTVAIIVKTSTSGAKTTAIVLYPEESGDYRADVVQWNGAAVATPAVAGIPEVNVSYVGGTAQNISARLDATISSRASQASVDALAVPSAAAIAAAVHDEIIEGSYTLRKYLRGFAAVLMGRLSGGGTATEIFRDTLDSKPRITAAVDPNGNRTAVTLDLD